MDDNLEAEPDDYEDSAWGALFDNVIDRTNALERKQRTQTIMTLAGFTIVAGGFVIMYRALSGVLNVLNNVAQQQENIIGTINSHKPGETTVPMRKVGDEMVVDETIPLKPDPVSKPHVPPSADQFSDQIGFREYRDPPLPTI